MTWTPGQWESSGTYSYKSRFTRATRCIDQDVLPEVTPAVEEQLLQLHPPATATAIPALPPNAPIVPVLGDDTFVKLWKKRVAHGAAPAVSGFTGDHGLPLLEDPHCLRGLSLLIQLIRNGQLSPHSRALLPVIPTVNHTSYYRRDVLQDGRSCSFA